MLFNSLDFVFFFPLVVAAYFLTPRRYRWILLLGASYYFYACWKLEYLVLIMLSTVVDFYVALHMGKRETRRERRPFLALSLIVNLGILFSFKYFNFFTESVQRAFDQFNIFVDAPVFDVLLPVGISFYTFQTLAYSIEVYRGTEPAENHLGIFALYVSFFPQLVAGPIERSGNLIPQFKEDKSFDYGRAVSGLQQMGWGFFKKIVIADRLAIYVDQVYNNPDPYTGGAILLATFFFAVQIYCDFSGYSDIAIGSARVMGYDLMENFRRPYLATSIPEFWRRWHISLSTWFRDYVYIPLGGNRVVKWRWYYNLFIVFLVSGLWHGAAWTFVIWGALHGIYMVASVATADVRDAVWDRLGAIIDPLREKTFRAAGFASALTASRIRKWVAGLVTFHLVLLGWVFFRANSVSDAFVILRNSISLTGDGPPFWAVSSLGAYELSIAFAAIATLLCVQIFEERGESIYSRVSRLPRWMRWSTYYALILTIIFFGEFSLQEFIYFQF